MIASPSKLEDMKLRAILIEDMGNALAKGRTDFAKELGALSKKLAHKIATYDYSEEDKSAGRLKEMERREKEIRAGIEKEYPTPWYQKAIPTSQKETGEGRVE